MNEHGELLHIDQPQAVRLRGAHLCPPQARRVATTLKALSDPTRLNLALTLRDGRELCVCDLAWVTERAQNLVSHHMRLLRQEGLVTARKEGKMTMYALTPVGVTLVGVALALAGEDPRR